MAGGGEGVAGAGEGSDGVGLGGYEAGRGIWLGGGIVQYNCNSHQEVNRAGELKGLGFFLVELLAETQQDGRREVRLLRAEVTGKNPLAAEPQGLQEPPGTVGKARRQHGNRLRIIDPQATGDAVAAIQFGTIRLAGVQGMFGRQEMGKCLEAIARRQFRNQALDDHGRAAGGRAPAIAVANGPQFHLEADFFARPRRPQRVELRWGNDPRRLQGHGLDANRLLPRAGEETQVVAAEEVPAAMVPGSGQGGACQKKDDQGGHVPPLAPEHEPTAQACRRDSPPDRGWQRPIAIDDHARGHGGQHDDQGVVAGPGLAFRFAVWIDSGHGERWLMNAFLKIDDRRGLATHN